MKGMILLIVGVILIGAGALAYFTIDTALEGVDTESIPFDFSFLRYGVGGLVGGIGLILAICGLVGISRGLKKAKEDSLIIQTGTDADAVVTFVDKNYTLLVNNRPIYSIVEYSYLDKYGDRHTNRIETLNSEQVIRNQIQVGATIAIKYSTEDPAKSTIVM